jgi:hypothetical protein
MAEVAFDKFSAKKVTKQEYPEPPWVRSARKISGLDLSPETSVAQSTLVSPLTSKEAKPPKRPWYEAGFTCDECPNKYRPHIARNGDTIRHQVFDLVANKIAWKSAWVADEPQSLATHYTKRCKECSSRMRTWTRSKKLADDITGTAEINGKRLRFVTLTLPNYDDIEFGIKDLKKKVRNFRYTKAYQEKVIGSADFYEWTEASDGSYNVHYHAIWIGDYWAHDNLLDTWAHGGARIELVKNVMKETKERRQAPAKRVLRYVMNYVKKMDRQGLRCQQRTGALYGINGKSRVPP